MVGFSTQKYGWGRAGRAGGYVKRREWNGGPAGKGRGGSHGRRQLRRRFLDGGSRSRSGPAGRAHSVRAGGRGGPGSAPVPGPRAAAVRPNHSEKSPKNPRNPRGLSGGPARPTPAALGSWPGGNRAPWGFAAALRGAGGARELPAAPAVPAGRGFTPFCSCSVEGAGERVALKGKKGGGGNKEKNKKFMPGTTWGQRQEQARRNFLAPPVGIRGGEGGEAKRSPKCLFFSPATGFPQHRSQRLPRPHPKTPALGGVASRGVGSLAPKGDPSLRIGSARGGEGHGTVPTAERSWRSRGCPRPPSPANPPANGATGTLCPPRSGSRPRPSDPRPFTPRGVSRGGCRCAAPGRPGGAQPRAPAVRHRRSPRKDRVCSFFCSFFFFFLLNIYLCLFF